MPLSPAAVQVWRLTTHVVQVMFACHLFISYGYELGSSEGPSMLPTINPQGDFILVEKWTHLSQRGYKVGDIIQGRHPYENHAICKRIVAKGGDIIRADGLKSQFIQVPKGHVWLQGDNLPNSRDSRDYGPVPEATLKGRVLARISFWNAPRFERLPNSLVDVPQEITE